MPSNFDWCWLALCRLDTWTGWGLTRDGACGSRRQTILRADVMDEQTYPPTVTAVRYRALPRVATFKVMLLMQLPAGPVDKGDMVTREQDTVAAFQVRRHSGALPVDCYRA